MECKNDVYDVSEHGYPSENRKSTSSHPIKSSDTLLAEAFELQKEYQTAQKKKVSDKRLQSIRVSIRGIYYQLIKQDPVTASEHDVEPMLWKYGFYKRIDELRVRLKKCQSALKKTPNNSQSQLERQAKVKKVFRNVVSEAKKFYESMFLEYLNAANVRRTGSAFVDLLVDASNETDDDGEADTSSSFSNGKDKDGHVDITSVSPAQRERMYLALHTAHRCLVYLGDLERYYQEHEEAEKKNWSKAERYYSQALQLLPENGNPHNQLAVVATFNQDDVSAAHRYFRSLAVLGLPFPTAKDNLALIFHKNELKFRKLFPRLSSKGSVSSRVDKKHIESRIKSKRELYICLLKMYSLVSSEGNDFNADDEQLFILLEKPVIHKVDELILRSPSISTDTKEKNSCLHFVLFLLVGCIFSVHRTLKGEGATVKYTPMTSHVCQWAFDFIGIIIQSISREDLSLLRPLGVFCDWLKLHPTLLKPSATSSSAYVSEAERAQRNLFWDQLSRLMNTLQHIAIDKEEALSPGGPALPEEMELRGFSYLRDAYATVGSDFASVRKTGELAPGSAKSKRKSRGRYRREKLQSLHVSRRILKVLNFGKLVADKFGLLTFNKSTNLWSFVPLIYESSKYVRSPSSKGRTSPSNAIAPSSSSTSSSSSSSSSAMYGAGSNTGDIGGSSSRHSSRSSRAHESHRRALLHKRSISQGNLAELNEPSLYQRERERSERHPNLERRSQSDRSLETAHMQQNHMSMSGHHSPSLTLSHPHHLNGAPQHRQGSSPTQGLHNVMHHPSQPQQQPQQTDMYVDSPSSSSHGRGRRSPVAVGSGSSTPNRVDPFGTPTHKNSNMLPHKTPGKLTSSSSSSSCAPSDEQLHHHHQWNPLGEQKQYLNFFEFGTHLGSGGNGTSTPSAASTGSTSSSSSSSLSSSSHWPTASNPTSDHTLGSSFSSWQKNNYNSAFVSTPNHSHQQGYGSSQWGQPQLQGHGPSTSPPSSSPSSSSSSMVRNQQGTVPQSRHHNSQHHNHNNHHPTSTSSSSSSSAPVHGNHHGVSAHSHRVSEQLSSYGESMFGVNTMSQEGVNLHQHPHSLSHHPHQPHTMNNTHHTNSLPPPPSSSSSSTSNSAAAWGNPNPNQQSFIDEANYFSAFGSSSSSLFSMAPTTPTSGNTSGKSSPPHSLFMGSAYAPQQQQSAPEGHLRQNKSVHHEAPHVYGDRHHGEEYGWGQASYSRNHNNYH